MRLRHLTCAVVALAVALVVAPRPADAQIGKLKDAAKRAAENETANQVERLLREAIRCAVDDPRCPEQAEREGKPVIYTDASGEVITDDEGAPITDREEAAARSGTAPGASVPPARGPKPGEGVWANYDFVPGERVLFAEDFADDRVGNFPRRLTFVSGNMEVVEWEGDRYLRVNDTGRVFIPLAEPLPERFTIEFTYHQPAGHLGTWVMTGLPDGEDASSFRRNQYPGAIFHLGNQSGVTGDGPESMTRTRQTKDGITAVRIQVDGSYAKMYLEEQRVANIPNATLLRSGGLTLQISGRSNSPSYLGDLVIAAGGRELYDVLEAEGRVTTRGILFDVDSDRLRPESTPTLQQIGRVLEDHPELRLRIEGHTDADGEDAYNLDLSSRRAASVKTYLVAEHGIDTSRLETVGHGETKPVADNATSEGKAQNRRVELVKL